MTHIIMSGPIRPLTETEEAAARIKRQMDGGGLSLSHPLFAEATGPEDCFISAREAIAILGCPQGSLGMHAIGWRRKSCGMNFRYHRHDVEETAERLKQRKSK